MADSNTQLHWTDEQWNKVRQVVYEEARKARVAGNFLPLYGPLEPDADYVRQQTIGQRGIQRQVSPTGEYHDHQSCPSTIRSRCNCRRCRSRSSCGARR